MRPLILLMIPPLLAASEPVAEPPVAPVEVQVSAWSAESGFAPPRRLDAPADPIVPAKDGTRSVKVAVLEPTDGALTFPANPAAVQAEVERNAGLLQRCWASRAGALSVREGLVEIHVHIGPDGLVHGQCIGGDSFGDDALLRCVNDLMAMGRYPTSLGTVDVSLQFQLTSPRR